MRHHLSSEEVSLRLGLILLGSAIAGALLALNW